MATVVDQKIVQMKFDNKEFDDGIKDTMTLLEKFKLSLGFTGATKGLQEIDKAAKKVDLSGLSESANAVSSSFDAMQVVAITALANMTNSAVNAGKQIVSSLTIDQVTSGFDKYEQKVLSVQTIMNATGKSIEEVSEELGKLIWFTDETSYSFTDMVANVGKFTSNQIELSTAVRAMMGIADAAGLAGASISDASHAMDGFSKAIASGYMDRQTWQWIQTAHMDTAEFKKQLMEAAYQAGTLNKVGEDLYETIGKKTTVSVAKFEQAMAEGWMTTEVMLRTLDEFGGYAEQVYRLYEAGMSTSDAIEKLSGSLSDVGEAGFKASQEAKTFTDAVNAVKDAVSSGWMQTFEYIFGNKDEAVSLWTDFTNELWEIFASGGDYRNEVLAEWVEWEGRDKLLSSLYEAYENIKSVVASIRIAFTQMFPPYTVDTLKDLTLGFSNLVKQLTPSKEALYTIYVVTKAILTPFRLLFTVIKNVGSVIGILVVAALKLVDAFLAMWAKGNPIADLLKNIFGEERYAKLAESFGKIIERIGDFFTPIVDAIKQLIKGQEELSPIATFMQKILDILGKVKEVLLNLIVDGIEKIANFDFTPIVNFFKSVGEFFKSGFTKGGDILSTMVENFKALTSNLKGEKPANLIEGTSNAITNLRNSFSSFLSSLGKTEAAQKAGVWIGRLADFLKSLGEALMRVIERLTPARILLYTFVVSMVSLIYSVSGAVTSMSGVFESFSGVMDALASRIGTTSSPIEEISKAIMMLVASVLILTMIDPEKLEEASWSLVKIASSLGGLMIVISAIGIIAQKIPGVDFDKFDDSVRKMSVSLVLLGAAMSLVSASIFLLDQTSLQSIPVKLLIISGIIAGLSLVVLALTKMPKFDNDAVAMVASIASIAIGINLIVSALNKMEVGNWATMAVNLTGVTLILIALKAVLANSYGVNLSSAAGLFLTILSLTSLARALETLSKFDTVVLIEGLLNFIPVFGALGSIAIALGVLGKSMSQAATSIMMIGIGVLALSGVIKIVSGMEISEIVKGMVVIGAVLGFFEVFQLISKAASDAEGSNMSKTLIGLGISLIAMSAAIAIIGTMRLDVVLQGTLVVGALISLMALVILASKSAEKVSGTIISLTAAVIALSAAVALLSLLEPEEAIIAVSSVAALLLTLGATLKLIGSGKFSITGMLNLVEIALLLVGLGYGLKLLKDMDILDAIPSLIGLSACLLVLSACLSALGVSIKIAKTLKIEPADMAVTAAIVLLLGAIGIAMAKIASIVGITNQTALINGIRGMAGVILALASCLKTFEYLEKASKMDPDQIGMIISTIGVLGILGGALVVGIHKFIPDDIDPISMATKIASMAGVILSLSACMMVLDKLWKIPIMKPKELAKVAISMAALGAVGGGIVFALSRIEVEDPAGLLTSVVAMSASLIALSGVLTILSAVAKTIKKTDFASLGVVGIALLAVAGIGAGLVAILNMIKIKDANTLVTTITALSAAMIALSMVVAVMGGVSKLVAGVDLSSMANLLALIAITVLVAGAIAAVASLVPLETIQNGGKVLFAIGEAIGLFVGGILGGVVGGTVAGVIDNVAVSLAGFVETAAPFIELMTSTSGDKLLSALGTLTGLILGLTADSIVSGILGLVGGDASLRKFGRELSSFGDDFAEFATTLDATDVDVDKLTSLIDAATKVTDFASGIPPQDSDTIRAWFFGDTSLASFGTGLVSFANGIAEMSNKALGFTISDETIAAYKKLTVFASEIPGQGGGLKQWLVGDSSLGTFGKELKTFSKYIALFDDGAKNFSISQETVDSYSRLAKFAGEIPAQPTWFDKWFGGGDTSLSKFGEELAEFGKHIAKYYKKVSDVEDPSKMTNAITPLYPIIALGTSTDFSKFNLDNFKKINAALTEMTTYPVDDLPNFSNLGINMLTEFVNGLKSPTLATSAKQAIMDILSGINNVFSSNKTLDKIWGEDLVQYFINGIVEKTGDAIKAVVSLCNSLAGAAEITLGINSPSKVFEGIGEFITLGLVKGISDGKKRSVEAISIISNSIISSVRSIFKIHSPSVVMEEIGHFVVQGLAEGITGDMTAVEAAKQMADNIVSAFREGLDALSLDITTVDLEQQLWEALYGDNMSEEEIAAKNLETLEKKMTLQAERVAYAEAQYKAIVQAVGEESEEAQSAYNSYLQEMITLTGLASDMLGDQTVEVKDQREALREYMAYMEKNRDPLLSMGFAIEEIEQAAREASGYLAGQDPYENIKMVDELVSEYLRAVTVELDTTVAEAIETAVSREVAEAVASGSTSGLEEGLGSLGGFSDYNYSPGADFEEYMQEVMAAITGGEGEEGGSIFGDLFNPEDFKDSIISALDFNLDFFTEKGDGLINGFGELAKGALNQFLSAWGLGSSESGESEFSDAASNVMAGMEQSIIERTPDVENALDNMATGAIGTVNGRFDIHSPSKVFEEIGTNTMSGLVLGISEGSGLVFEAIDTMAFLSIKRAIEAFEEAYPGLSTKIDTSLSETITHLSENGELSMNQAGVKIGTGLADGIVSGINSNKSKVVSSATNLGNSVASAMAAALGVHSPSKVAERIAMFVDLGFANGLREYSHYVKSATEEVGEETVNGLNSTIEQAAALAEDVLSGEPVIRPVLDLDDLKKDMAQISGMFATQQAVSIQADIAKRKTSEENQNGGDSSSGEGTNFTFVQNNYSPKALSRAEIYRQTNNQFAAFKERVSLAR